MKKENEIKINRSKLSYVSCMMILTGDEDFEDYSDDDIDWIYYNTFSRRAFHLTRQGYIDLLYKRREEIKNQNNP